MLIGFLLICALYLVVPVVLWNYGFRKPLIYFIRFFVYYIVIFASFWFGFAMVLLFDSYHFKGYEFVLASDMTALPRWVDYISDPAERSLIWICFVPLYGLWNIFLMVLDVNIFRGHVLIWASEILVIFKLLPPINAFMNLLIEAFIEDEEFLKEYNEGKPI